MLKATLTTLLAAIGMTALALTNPALASTVETDHVDNTTDHAFDSFILNNDLINTGQTSLASESESAGGPIAGTIAGTNDGSTSFNPWVTMEWVNNTDVLTYQLNTNPGTGGSATGYDLTTVNVIAGWTTVPPWGYQAWALQVATLTNPTFTTYANVSYAPDNQATMVTLTDTTGKIASGVTGVQFVFNTSLYTATILHEIDVTGSASPAPEPASLGLLAAGGLLLMRRRRI